MQNVYRDTSVLDKRVREKFRLSEEILIENASNSLMRVIEKITHKGSVITIVCGGGNNGADGLSLARKLCGDYVVRVLLPKEPKTNACINEIYRAQNLKIEFVKKLGLCDVVVDCLFGVGFRGELDSELQELIRLMNGVSRFRVACDIPSGLSLNGEIKSVCFMAHYTIAMGAINLALFSENAKNYVGEIVVGDLGIARNKYEIDSNIKLLDIKDLRLPHRKNHNVNKGSFGHLSVFVGEKKGAGMLSAMSSFAFGVGLVSVVGELDNCPYEIMNPKEIPENTTAVALGMGYGNVGSEVLHQAIKYPCVLDADVFKSAFIGSVLEKENTSLVLTPHIKEFSLLLENCGIPSPKDIEELKSKRVDFVSEFCAKYPNVVLVLKGANTLIAQNGQIYISSVGHNNLAKGGSGDVLSGLIASLLAQGYSGLESAINGILAHSKASMEIKSDFGLTPMDLIEKIKFLKG